MTTGGLPNEIKNSASLMLSVSGCRGIVGQSLTPIEVCRYASMLASRLRIEQRIDVPRVVVARDGRAGGDVLARAAISALASSGCEVIDIGVATTPTVGVMVTHLDADAGLTLTASHNPGQWNGLKPITRDGAAPSPADAQRLIEAYRAGASAYVESDQFGEIQASDAADHVHVARVLAALDPVVQLDAIQARGFRVLVDSVNASGARPARMLLEALGCEVLHINSSDSGIFPHPPEPTEDNLREVASRVRGAGVDAGFVQDPDADRLALLDANGVYIGEEYTLVLGAMSLLASPALRAGSDAGSEHDSEGGVTLVANLSTSRMIDDVADQYGARVRRAPVGEANVVDVMRQASAVVGGEGNGGVIWPEVGWIRDSLVAMALTLALLTRENRTLSEIVGGFPAYAIEKRKTPIAEGLADRAQAAIERTFGARPGANIDRQDGVRIDIDAPGGQGRAWLHVRPSNTEPILRLIAEAPRSSESTSILDEAERAIEGAR